MKTVFTSLDVAAVVLELQQVVGMRVTQVYDVDSKTYLFKLHRGEEKCVLLMESGARFHTTNFDWPKNVSPSGFTMKLRKHIKNKRIDSIEQLGTDRIVVVKFGSGEATYNVILELFNRGNILLADHSLMILNVLRPHTEGDRFKFAVKETYPADRARTADDVLTVEKLREILFPTGEDAKKKQSGQKLHKSLLPFVDYGSHLLEHALITSGFTKNSKVGSDIGEDKLEDLAKSLSEADAIFKRVATVQNKGYIITKHEKRVDQEELVAYLEFHPVLFKHLESGTYIETDNFNAAVDEFFSKLESQKIELKALNMEKEAMNKVDKIRENQKGRMIELASKQEVDRKKAELIMCNSEVVEQAINAVRVLIVSQMSWDSIGEAIEEAQSLNDPVANIIKKLRLEVNHITLSLSDPYEEEEVEPTLIDVNLDLSAHANAKLYYDNKKNAALKEKKTLESQGKAIKSAEKKAKQTLKEIHTMTAITKARKTCWFEKFLWFISSENYLVIGGRDVQQNELIVKRYMTQGDVYVHADLHGASSVVIKNPSGKPIPPKTLSEAGTMAVSYSAGWSVNVLCPAWWVRHHQVSKTAPAGEYLTPGSFMIRGTKNYLAPTQLALGFGFLFRLEESSLERHSGERCVRNNEDIDQQIQNENEKESEELVISDGDDDHEPTDTVEKMEPVPEEEGNEDEDGNDQDYPDTELDLNPISIQDQFKHESQLARVTPEVISEGVANLKVKNKNQKNKKDVESGNESEDDEDLKPQKTGGQQQIKRGQRSKLKKIKGKYKDQDEEEKQLRMAILQSAGEKKEPKRGKKKNKEDQKSLKQGNQPKQKQPPKPQVSINRDVDDDQEEQEVQVTADVDIVNYFTGQPHPDDELLYALPVVAPYNTLLSYKFKLKMLPGTAKRGKAAKAAVVSFTRGKDISQHEKDLIRNVDDHLLIRNFPGKVKMVTNVQKKK
uniref:Nuclear export mediator factor NEMF n=1 Tax=Lygus hesperus TaxID=30085 RepID=A0A146LJ84_LYGHE